MGKIFRFIKITLVFNQSDFFWETEPLLFRRLEFAILFFSNFKNRGLQTFAFVVVCLKITKYQK